MYRLAITIGKKAIVMTTVKQEENYYEVVFSDIKYINRTPKGLQKASPNQLRTEKRQRRKNLRRKAQRKNDVKSYVKEYFKVEPDYHTFTKCVYEIRAEAIKSRVSLEELAKILLHLAKFRGFKSSRKNLTENEQANSEYRLVAEWNAVLNATASETIGEFLYKRKNKKIKINNISKNIINDYINFLISLENTLNIPVVKIKNALEKVQKRIKKHITNLKENRLTINEIVDFAFDLEETINGLPNIPKDIVNKLIEIRDKLILKKYYDFIISGNNVRRLAQSNLIKPVQVLIEKEFHKIWEVQKKYYPDILTNELKEKFYNTIFFRNPIRQLKNLRGKCNYNPKKMRGHTSHPVYENYKALMFINNHIKLYEKDKLIPLSKEQRKKILNSFLNNGTYKSSEIKKLLNINKNSKLKIEVNEKINSAYKVSFNPTMYKILGDYWESFEDSQKETIWNIVHSYDDPEKIKKVIHNVLVKFNIPESEALFFANQIANVKLSGRWGNYSISTLRKVIPHLQNGFTKNKAFILAGIDNALNIKSYENEKLYSELTEIVNKIKMENDEVFFKKLEIFLSPIVKKYGLTPNYNKLFHPTNGIRKNYYKDFLIAENSNKEEQIKKHRKYIDGLTNNPELRAILHQVYNIIHKVIEEFNIKPDELEVYIKNNREVKPNKNQKSAYEEFLKIQEELKKEAKKHLQKLGIKEDDYLIRKYLLWKEQNEKCVYSGKVIPLKEVFAANTEISHIVPPSATFNNDITNEVLVFHNYNEQKAKQTPYEWITNNFSEDKWNEFRQRVNDIYSTSMEKYNNSIIRRKIRRKIRNLLQRKTVKEIQEDVNSWLNSQFNDTSLLASLTKKMILDLFKIRCETVKHRVVSVVERKIVSKLIPDVLFDKEYVLLEEWINTEKYRFLWLLFAPDDSKILAYFPTNYQNDIFPSITKNSNWILNPDVNLNEIKKRFVIPLFGRVEDQKLRIMKNNAILPNHYLEAIALGIVSRKLINTITSKFHVKKLQRDLSEIELVVPEYGINVLPIHHIGKKNTIISTFKKKTFVGNKIKTVRCVQVRGALHEETIYGKRNIKGEEMFLVRKPIKEVLNKIPEEDIIAITNYPFNINKDLEKLSKYTRNLIKIHGIKLIKHLLTQIDNDGIFDLQGNKVRTLRVKAKDTPNILYKPQVINNSYVNSKNNNHIEIYKKQNKYSFKVISLYEVAQRKKNNEPVISPEAIIGIRKKDLIIVNNGILKYEEYKEIIKYIENKIKEFGYLPVSEVEIYKKLMYSIYYVRTISNKVMCELTLHLTSGKHLNIFPFSLRVSSINKWIQLEPYLIKLDKINRIMEIKKAF